MEVKQNLVQVEDGVKAPHIKQQTIYPGQRLPGLKKPANAQIWHADWGETWESRAEFMRKKAIEDQKAKLKEEREQARILKERVSKCQQELDAMNDEKRFECVCGKDFRQSRGLKIHQSQCEKVKEATE